MGCQTKNQARPAVSTDEAELNGLEFVGKELEWTSDFLQELQIDTERPFIVYQDNAAALALTKDPVITLTCNVLECPAFLIRQCVRS